MDYEKAYNEALETARKINNGDGVAAPADWTVCETIFPVLREDYDDMIRGAIIDHLKDNNLTEWADWLEKQGGQKSVDKVEPKFHEGEWVIGRATENEPRQIAEITEEGYKTTYGGWIGFSFEEDIRLWTIQDAKDGDVLTDGDMFVIFKSNNHDPMTQHGCMFVYCSMMKNNSGWHEFWYESGGLNPTYYLPATKEQRDLLFQKMREAGYEWDAEKKELKKIEDEIGIPFGARGSELQESICYIPKGFYAKIDDDKVVIKKGENPAWSEEDERIYRGIHNLIYSTPYCDSRKELSDWLKSLKDRVQLKKEWSEEDKNAIKVLKNIIKKSEIIDSIIYTDSLKEKLYNWLESLMPQNNITDEELAQAKKDAYNDALNKIEYHSGEPTFDDGWSAAIWYLKKRNTMPQSQWKPSDEQMGVIEAVINNRSFQRRHLDSLYEQLKKLREE